MAKKEKKDNHVWGVCLLNVNLLRLVLDIKENQLYREYLDGKDPVSAIETGFKGIFLSSEIVLNSYNIAFI